MAIDNKNSMVIFFNLNCVEIFNETIKQTK